MRKLILLAVVTTFFFACKSGWTSDQKEAYMGSCTRGLKESGMEEDKAKDYCSCMMEKTEKKFPNVSDASKLTEEERSEWAKDCLK